MGIGDRRPFHESPRLAVNLFRLRAAFVQSVWPIRTVKILMLSSTYNSSDSFPELSSNTPAKQSSAVLRDAASTCEASVDACASSSKAGYKLTSFRTEFLLTSAVFLLSQYVGAVRKRNTPSNKTICGTVKLASPMKTILSKADSRGIDRAHHHQATPPALQLTKVNSNACV